MTSRPHLVPSISSVRTASARVVQHATSVALDGRRIEEFAVSLSALNQFDAAYDVSHHIAAETGTLATYTLVLGSVNFGSGYARYFHTLVDDSVYYTVAAAIRELFSSTPTFTAGTLQRFILADAQTLFAPYADHRLPEIQEFFGLFTMILNELGTVIEDRYAGDFCALIEDAAHSAEKLVHTLIAMDAFKDVSEYRGGTVPFLKKAQLLVWDLHLAFRGRGLGQFEDIHCLTVFADNVLPQVFQSEGLIVYSEQLLTHLRMGIEIPHNGSWEIELRASAIHAAEQLLKAMHAHGSRVRPVDLDFYLWTSGHRARYRTAGTRHRTRTVYY